MRRLGLVIAILGPILFAGCGQNPKDFLKFADDEPWTRPTDCRANIATALCVVDSGSGKRPCLGGESAYVSQFETLYDGFPPELQKMFCSLRHLYIENQLTSTAYAQRLVRSNGTVAEGANVGIRRSVLDQAVSYTPWESWKEQLSFGGVAGSYTPRADLPFYEATGTDDQQLFLYIVIAHEFGHLFDFANGVNNFSGTLSTWSALSWADSETPNIANRYASRTKFCFYGCSGTFANPADANTIYAQLDATNFISSYASSNPYDDFAESVAYYYAHFHRGQEITLNTALGQRFAVTGKVLAPVFAAKLSYLQNFFARTDISYP